MFFKKATLVLISFATFLGASSYLNNAFANEKTQPSKVGNSSEKNHSTIEKQAIDRVTLLYPEFINLVKNGANNDEMTEFFKKTFDIKQISIKLCGTESEKVIETVVKFLLWRLKTESIQSVKNYELDKEMSVNPGKTGISLYCKLNSKTSKPVEMKVIFSAKGNVLGKATELEVLGIPLIKGIKAPIGQFFEKNGLKINDMREEERPERIKEAIDDFIANNSKDSGEKSDIKRKTGKNTKGK